MDKGVLSELLDEGLSLAEIGRRVGLDDSTVGYWAKKHGLEAVNATKHAGRGGVDRAVLVVLVGQGLSIRQIAARLDFSPSAIRHWLKQYGLETRRTTRLAAGREAKALRMTEAEFECAVHGRTEFRLEGRGVFRCLACRQERVSQRRRDMKAALVAEAGGACTVCGYDGYIGALQFHHLDPASKRFGIAAEGVTRSLDSLRGEAANCVLLCANCHAEVEGGVRTLEPAADKVIEPRGLFAA